uniref:hypothetical protein n=1 Tax=Thaumasiovibrio occultus TaxID=1891184 RepID=UPI000B35C931|nr:hypothetical protein [Thaumasiovibrio occultus]
MKRTITYVAAAMLTALSASAQALPTLDIEIAGRGDALALDAFLQEHLGQRVALAVSVCGVAAATCPSVSYTNNTLVVDAMEYDANYDPICEYDDTLGEGMTVYFSESDTEYLWGWEKFATCKDGSESGLFTVMGEFIVPENAGYGMGWTEWMLTKVE